MEMTTMLLWKRILWQRIMRETNQKTRKLWEEPLTRQEKAKDNE